MKIIMIQYTFLVSFLLLNINPLLFADSPTIFADNPPILSPSFFPDSPLLSPHPTVEDNMMPDTLEFLQYEVYRLQGGMPIGSNLKSNILPESPACLYAIPMIDRYGNPKIYAGCTGTKTYNPRDYPPLYPGDVFPILEQLYYFESVNKAIKVLEVKDYPQIFPLPKGRIILPLAPPDLLPSAFSQIMCRSSGLLDNNGAVSLVHINEIYALIYSDCSEVGNVSLERLGKTIDSFKTKKVYQVGDILTSRYLPDQEYRNTLPKVGFKITKIVPPDPERNRVFQTVEGEKTGRLIGWVELDPTPIPVDENGKPIN